MTAHRTSPHERAEGITFTLDGRPVSARRGETVAAALMADGRLRLRDSPRAGTPRGAFCLMGVCQECVVLIDGMRRQACMVEANEGMKVEVGP